MEVVLRSPIVAPVNHWLVLSPHSTMKFLILALLGSLVSGFAPTSSVPRSTKLHESFGFDFAEDTYKNQAEVLGGEANYKQWVNKIDDNSMLNRKYNVVRRVRELELLKVTADNGVLSKLEAQGLDLATIEKLLPVAEELGLLSLAGNNQQLLVNLAAPLLVEPAPILIPFIAGAIGAGPSAFYAASAGLFGLDAFLFANDVELPFVGLSAGVFLGLLLVPLGVVSGAAGVALGSLKK